MQAVGVARRPNPLGGRMSLGGRGGAGDDLTAGAAAAAIMDDLDFYSDLPSKELSLDEFEELALARLKVLRKIEELKTRNVTGEAYRMQLDKTIKANLHVDAATTTSASGGKLSAKQVRNRNKHQDISSHFILRAAYCRTEDLRRWFLTQECALFQHRLEKASKASGALQAFLHRAGLKFDRVSDSEKDRLRQQLLSVPGGAGGEAVSPAEFVTEIYYRVPFVQALDLIANRQAYVEAGFAYVPLRRIVSIVRAKFRMALSKSLVLASSAFSQVAGESARIGPLLKSMNQQYTGKDYGAYDKSNLGAEELTAQNVDMYAERSMPLCMSQLHSGLKRDHKLKHWGRLQYGLFLKGAGLSMEESLLFFQREFGKIMTAEQFNKNYSYNIRHMYGKEGKRASYTPYNCTKIVLGNPPNAGDHHGCPYRHYDEEHLGALLAKMKIGSPADRNEILNQKRSKNFQLACVKHFEITHPQAASTRGANLDGVGNHPNAWFAASVSYHNAKSGGTSSGGTIATALGAAAPAAKMEAASPNAKSEDSKQAAVL